MFEPRAIVAIILAITVLLFMLSNTTIGMVIGDVRPNPQNAVVAEAWINLTNVLIGGLIGYIAGRKEDK